MALYKNIIVVGTNNTSRSFMAEVVLQKLCAENGMEDVKVASRGLVVLFSEPVSPKAADVVREAGYSIRDFQASKLTAQDVEHADLILTVTSDEKEKLSKEFEEELRHPATVATLSEFAGEQVGIPDPYGGGKEDYESCFIAIKRIVEKCFEDIRRP